MQHFYVPVAHSAAEVHFVVKDNDVFRSQIIGVVGIPVDQLLSRKKVEGTFPILDESGKPWKIGAVLSVSIQYIPLGKMTLYNSGVPGTYFPLRKGGKVTLYQDAHVQDGCLPNLRLDHDIQYKHGNCWRDIFDAISQVCRLIYNTGWSVYHQVRLVCENDNAAEVTLGDLLKTKSQQGVRVLLLVWNDPTSWNIMGYQQIGPTLEDVGYLLRLPMLGKVDPSSGRLSPSQQSVVDALRKSVRREKGQGGGKKGHGGVKNTFTEWARYWYKDLGASRAGEEAPVVIDGPGLKEPAHLAAFLAYWLTWYIFPGPPKDGVDTALFELAAILASGESVPLAPLFLGTLFKRLDMLHDAARRSCGRYDLPIYVAANFLHMFLFERFPKVAPEPNDFGGDDGGGEGEPCRSVCRSAQWSGSGVRDVRGGIADVIDIEGEFVARLYVNTPKGVFSFNVYSEEDVVTFPNKDDASTAELFRMSCMMRGELPYFVNGKYGSVTYDPMRVARQFGYDQGVPKSLLPSGAVGDVWKRFLKSAFPA
ncbi:hypothetical protein RHGRI_029232 [Rhododendron griersonianum]|uniref:Aminotransferase-like plant mobile domain-containing protein n=1 Tax=Rhododendron griersonianum TaxID=479676 RepID=A0AAV6IIY5_9ERIC|nr:hypothetical protein RHGRI_029232 [Rhododendron griersonianum]